MIARLHHELVGKAPRCLALAHGIFGAGANLRGVATKLVARRPDWSVALVDLRAHGRSEVGAPPHTIDACAADVVGLPIAIERSGSAGPRSAPAGERRVSIDAFAGHSFGGKVALAARRLRSFAATWVLDASPTARVRDASVVDILALMERLPKTWARRADFVAAVVAAGHPQALATWLAMNVKDGALQLDLPVVRALLEDYFRHDAWDVVAGVDFVVADRSAAITADDQQRLVASGARVHHVDAGHWVHVDAPGAVVDLLAAGLPP